MAQFKVAVLGHENFAFYVLLKSLPKNILLTDIEKYVYTVYQAALGATETLPYCHQGNRLHMRSSVLEQKKIMLDLRRNWCND